MANVEKQSQRNNAQTSRAYRERRVLLLQQWAGALLPVGLVLISGWIFFRQAIIQSIAATPHPELIYIILGTFFTGVLLSTATLYRYSIEGNLMFLWLHAAEKHHHQLIKQLKWRTYFMPIYQIFMGHRSLQHKSQQAIIEQEMEAIQERLNDRLVLPQYLSGALVGLGLVGTFIGLLGTLEDLGKLFGALVQTSSTDANPAEIFTDMVRRLQDPMRGMGTAFVASLYGLFGSLLLGLQILAVEKVGHSLSNQLHALVRHAEAVEERKTPTEFQQQAIGQEFHVRAIQQIVETARIAQIEQAKRWRELNALVQRQQEVNHEETKALRREIFGISESNRILSLSMREGLPNEKLLALTSLTIGHQKTLADIAQTLRRIEQGLTTAQSQPVQKHTSAYAEPPTLKESIWR
jgi:hypothetical protein